ncbi:MAG: hypothetical protein Q9217_006015, partial [Psora testacea]
MSLGPSSDISDALGVLLNASGAILRPYRTDLVAVFQKIDGSTNSDLSLPTPVDAASLGPVENFVKKLQKDLKKIKKLLLQAGDDACQNKRTWTTEDPRIVDIHLAGKKSLPENILRRGLSQRSLATEFNDWQSITH